MAGSPVFGPRSAGSQSSLPSSVLPSPSRARAGPAPVPASRGPSPPLSLPSWLYKFKVDYTRVVGSRTRVVIAGGGVLGTMHAVMARRRGFEVVQLEREAEARGASVRNFGLVWVSGRKAGPELSLALRARELWADLGARVPGIGFRAAGSLTLATGDAELTLLKEAAALPDA